jgi:ACS family hexuronate transporter-like MFS transporter
VRTARLKLRWVIAGLLLLATMINYIDRLTLSVVISEVRAEFSLTERDYSQIVSIFLLAYAIMYTGSGYAVDRLGTRRGFALFIGLWSGAQMLHGAARGKWSLAGCRFLLGLTEPGNFPAAVRAVNEWFPPAQRAIGVGIFNAGSALGSAAAAPLAAWLTLRYGWRFAFVFTGSLGLVWLAAWLAIYRTPASSMDGTPRGAAPAPDWRRLLRSRECLALVLARFLTDPVIYFVIFWLPEYLRKERGFDLAMIGQFAWMPFLFGDVGYVLGGWLSGKLAERGFPLRQARKTAMLVGACLLPAAAIAPLAPSAGFAIAATCVVVLGHAIWITNLLTLPADLFPAHEVGTATGLSGTGGAVGGMLANLAIGYVVSRFSYLPVFLIAAVLHPLGWLLIHFLLVESNAHAPGGRPLGRAAL